MKTYNTADKQGQYIETPTTIKGGDSIMNKLTARDLIVSGHLEEEYEEYFNSLQDGEVALSFREWLEAIS